jgi:hypothetical protein
VVLTEISGLCIKEADNNVKHYADNLLIFNKNSGKIQLYNYNRRNLLSNNSVLNKNFVSKTEREMINLRQLKLAEFNPENNLMLTYEEIKDKEYFINSYLKLWKVNFGTNKEVFKSDLLCIAENCHNNESIKGITFDEETFMSFSDTSFKYWKINEGLCELVFKGNYKNKKINSACFLEYYIYSLHGNVLIQWNKVEKTISNIFSLSCFGKDENLTMIPTNKHICIYSQNKVALFNINEWDIVNVFETNTAEVVRITENEETNELNILLKRENYYLVIKYLKGIFTKCLVAKKTNVSFIDYDNSKQGFVILGKNSEIFVSVDKSKTNAFLGKKKKKEKVKIEKVLPTGENMTISERANIKMDIDDDLDDIFEANLNRIKIKK